MADSAYALTRAAADLQAAGLLEYALLSADESWCVAETAALPGAFQGAVLDSRRVEPGELFVALKGEKTTGRRFIGAALATGAHALTDLPAAGGRGEDDPLTSTPAPAGRVVLVSAQPRRALARLATCWRARQAVRVVAVTGSNGKTTTKDFLAALLGGAGSTLATAGNLNNELGLPLTLLGLRPTHRFAVVEMGASAVGEIARLASSARPEVGVITNAAEAHLAEFGSLAGVIEGKGELLDALPADGVAILNRDSPGFDRWRERARCRTISFAREYYRENGAENGAKKHGKIGSEQRGEKNGDLRWRWRADPDTGGGLLELDGEVWPVPLPGAHNAANLTAAILAARAVGAEDTDLRAGLARFAASPHRSRLVAMADDWQLLDDSYNANPASMRSAVEALLALAGGRGIAVLGTMAELGPDSVEIHRATGADLYGLGLDFLLTVGAEAVPLAEGFRAAGGEALDCRSHDEAVAWIRQQVRAGDRVLVKGSRSAAMDEIVSEVVTEACDQPEPADGAE